MKRRTYAEHARTHATCKHCKAERTWWVFICPDPHGAAQWRADSDAAAWLATHPCHAPASVISNAITTNTAGNARKRAAA